MRYNTLTFLALMFAVSFAFLTVTSSAFAAQEEVLYSFCGLAGCGDGQHPAAGLLMDKAGNLYGTAPDGGKNNAGVVYELSPTDSGWQQKVLHTFGGKPDGNGPVANLIMDEFGNVYGTTTAGGTFNDGTVFELTHATAVGWTERILHSFHQNGQDGSLPYAGLARDAEGNLYGTTSYGGPLSGCDDSGCGTVFELSPSPKGQWTEKILLAFNPDESLGANPAASLTLDQDGDLYGTAENGGSASVGVVFELVRNNGWKEQVLYNFGSMMYDGNNPLTNVIFDAAGNLYGTTGTGAYTTGSVFELMPLSNGQWVEKQLCVFCYGPGPVTFDHAGNLYTTCPIGGTYNYGFVYELMPTANGTWQQTVLNTFDGTNGSIPGGNLILDSSGNIYGVTSWGGAYKFGTVYEVTP
jgi:uncharacterized repeat protein (TIGR03803 family)